MRRVLMVGLWMLAAVGCSDPVDPCASEGPSMGVPALDVVTALRNAGAEVEDRGERLEMTLLGTPARELGVDGQTVIWYEYCSPSQAGAHARRFSADASTFDGTPTGWDATGHVYVLAQVILIYDGDDTEVIALLEEVMGAPVAEGSGSG